MTFHPQITITSPTNMGLPALPNTFIDAPGLVTAPVVIESYIIFAQGSHIYVMTTEANVICQVNIEHTISCITTYRYQGCNALVLGTDDGLLLLYSNLISFIETAQAKGIGARISSNKYISVADPSPRSHTSPRINGNDSIYCISLSLSPNYPLLAAGLDNGACLIISTESFTVLAVLKGSGYGVFQPDYKKAHLTCRCSVIYDHFTDLLDHMGYLSQRQASQKQKRSIRVNTPTQITLDESVHMDEESLRKLSKEQTYARICSMYCSMPKICSSCEQVYGLYLMRAIQSATQTSNLPGDLYTSVELDIFPRQLKKNTKPKHIPKEYVTCFGPHANPSIVYLQASFERNSHLGCTPDIASCLCWLTPFNITTESTLTKISTEFIILLIGGDDYCICLYYIPVALLSLANDSGIICNCRPHIRFYTSALSTYQNESIVGIDGVHCPIYECNPDECQLETTMFSPVTMHGFIHAYGDIEGIVQIPSKGKDLSTVYFGVKSALDGYSFYELSLNLLSKPMLDLTAYKGHYIPDFLLNLDAMTQNILKDNIINIFPKQSTRARDAIDHQIFYKHIVSALQATCSDQLKFFEIECTCPSVLRRLKGPVLPVHQSDQWIVVNMNRGKYEYNKAIPWSSWSFMDVQCTVKQSRIDGIDMLLDFNRYSQVSFYPLEDIATHIASADTATSCNEGGHTLLYPSCAIECPKGRPLFVSVLNKTIIVAVYDTGLYFCN